MAGAQPASIWQPPDCGLSEAECTAVSRSIADAIAAYGTYADKK